MVPLQVFGKGVRSFYNLGNPDKFFADRDASEWVSFTLTTKNHLFLNEITRITTQEPGNALNSFISTEPVTPLGQKDVTMSIVVHHQPHFTSQNQTKRFFGDTSSTLVVTEKSLINLISK